MRAYLTFIKITQTILLTVSVLLLVTIPQLVVFFPETLDQNLLYALAHLSLFFVMTVRPLADLLPKIQFIRPLVILRKGAGSFSAAIIVSFIIAKIIVDPVGYFSSFGTGAYWSFSDLALFAHLADISAVLLLITSNNLSKRLLKNWWKRIQRLSYVYFYGSTLYLLFIYQNKTMLFYITIVTLLTLSAFLVNRNHRLASARLAIKTI